MIGRRRWARGTSMAMLAAVYGAALAAGAGAAAAAEGLGAWQSVLLGDVVATLVVFLCAWALDNTSVYDPFWSVIPPALAVWWWVRHADPAADRVRLAVLLGLLAVWGIRLTGNFLRGWQGLGHEDWRYTEYRRLGPVRYWLVSLGGLHLMPTLVVFAAMLPVYAATVWPGRGFGALDVVAAVVAGSAVVVETIADEQKARFRRTAPRGSLLQHGVWRWVRHPNYTGEVAFWWGVFGFGVAASWDRWWTAAGAVAVTVLFVTVSVPLMDRHMSERRGGYGALVERIPALVPRPWRRGRGGGPIGSIDS